MDMMAQERFMCALLYGLSTYMNVNVSLVETEDIV